MHTSTRKQRDIVFFRENESALFNKFNIKGPAQFNLQSNKTISNHLNEPKFSMPKVSPLFYLINFWFFRLIVDFLMKE